MQVSKPKVSAAPFLPPPSGCDSLSFESRKGSNKVFQKTLGKASHRCTSSRASSVADAWSLAKSSKGSDFSSRQDKVGMKRISPSYPSWASWIATFTVWWAITPTALSTSPRGTVKSLPLTRAIMLRNWRACWNRECLMCTIQSPYSAFWIILRGRVTLIESQKKCHCGFSRISWKMATRQIQKPASLHQGQERHINATKERWW